MTTTTMIPVKIQCGCGQRYAFDVEAVNGAMPYAVACPTCGVDGTPAANSVISEAMGTPMTAELAPPPAPAFTPAPSSRSGAPVKQIDVIQITHEARAKMMWGDAPEDVTKFLMLQGMSHQEALPLSQALFAERAKAIRANGITKVWTGILLMCVPVVTFLGFRAIGMLPIKIIGISGAVGLWGAWRVLKGSIMIIAPKSEPGDVSEQ